MPYVFDPNDVHINTALTNISQAYKNEELVADRVSPRIPVTFRSDKYYILDEMEAFNVASDATAPNTDAREIAITLSSDEYAVKDYALGAWVPRETIANADDPVNPLGRAVEGIRNRLLLAREKRVADLVFAAATYPVGYKTTLADGSRWDDYTTGTPNVDPIEQLLGYMDIPLQRPNRLLIGAAAWAALRVHPAVVASIYPLGGNAGTGGVGGTFASAAALAEVLELDEVIVGRARYNTAAAGQAGSLSRIWGNHALLYYQEQSPSLDTPTSFFSFETTASNIVRDFDPKKGVMGSEYVKDGWSHVDKVVSAKSAYFIETVVGA